MGRLRSTSLDPSPVLPKNHFLAGSQRNSRHHCRAPPSSPLHTSAESLDMSASRVSPRLQAACRPCCSCSTRRVMPASRLAALKEAISTRS